MNVTILDYIPLWVLFVMTITLVMLAVEAGYLLGKSHQGRHVDTSPVSTMVGAALGLLAFMLAFTFGMSGNRFEIRKELVVEDANAIRTAYLRADLLNESERTMTRILLREYVDIRIDVSLHPEHRSINSLARTEQIQDQLWAIGLKLSQKDPNALFLQSLNNVFDNHNKRISIAFTNRIPGTIWLVLYAMLFFSMAAVGYYSGITVSRSRLIAVVLAVAFSAILILIDDLDRPQQGFLKVSQQAMISVRNKMNADAMMNAGNPGKSTGDEQIPASSQDAAKDSK
ncbi:MAG TPA: hypothetical protein DET40_13785 [Lentisphaeria bacterium]|nr:MAG: hypothetical protein A2X45_01795 [Lentisphaerae bacterium GWF2_50_93]HCE44612.1 hypothetical protein [Lentisphaeria bacterium]